jgi:predicted nucleotidyltransferase component of viral defense system
MSKAEPPVVRAHEDVALFREAVRFTAAESGFTPRLIEKDYFCTVLLAYLSGGAGDELVFKGGTCLAKVHAQLYRLSEDLDFTIPVRLDTPRQERSKRVESVRKALHDLKRAIPVFHVTDGLKGANKSTQYIAVVAYGSLLNQQQETIKIEVSLREPLLMPTFDGAAQTMLRSALTNNPMVTPIALRCIDKAEAFAEKFRAALSRREPAIRDFYDVDYAVRKGSLRPEADELVSLVKQKLNVPGNDPVDISRQRLTALRRQVDPQLRPVLREKDYTEFDLDRAFKIGVEMARAIELRQ